ncbi:protein kinase [Micromonospora sp. NPDC048909]|uniref:protein kinase domain-containing protein n=1 Tax=Micromonospora sp. NPDC048909 TaxID=3155643 RepID=UPI0033F09A22
MSSVGQLVGDRYRLTGRIAGGGMGDVWRAVDETLKRPVAVKMLHPRLVTDTGFSERFRREARAMASLRHPGIAEIYDYGETSSPEAPCLAYIVMELVQGQPLSQRIAEAGRLDTAETMSVAAQTARALQAAHDVGMVHRDVKPSNLIIEPDGHVVLVDFGVAVLPEAASLTGANQVVGTALYMAPEQVSRNETTPAIDIYALGAVVYQCLTGRPPYQGDNPVAVALRHLDDEPPPLPADVPAEARDLVATAMAKEPTDRYPTAAAMATAAQALMGSSDPQVTAPLAAAPGRPAATEQADPRPAGVAPAGVAPTGVALAGGALAGGAGRGRTLAMVLLGSLAALVAVLAFADPTGLMPGPGGRPTESPSTTPASGKPSPGAGGAEPVVSRSADGPSQAPGSTARTPDDPASATPSERPEPSGGSTGGGAPSPTGSAGNSQEPTASPTNSATAGPTSTVASTVGARGGHPGRPAAERTPR